jgi:hypothetical protein
MPTEAALDRSFQGIHTKQITTDCMYNSTTRQLNGHGDYKLPPGVGAYCFCIHSQIYHSVLPLYPKRQRSQDLNNFVF